jgi:Stage II sporulation protein E (SpoIIE)
VASVRCLSDLLPQGGHLDDPLPTTVAAVTVLPGALHAASARWFRAMRRWTARRVRRLREAEASWSIVLITITAVMTISLIQLPDRLPLTMLTIPLVIGILTLSVGRVIALVLVTVVCMTCIVLATWMGVSRLGPMFVVVTVAVIGLWAARSRIQLGVASPRGASMLIDLRDRLRSQSELPELPRSWYAEAVMRSAGGASFAGDFIVAAKTHEETKLEVAVVDVSGKGVGAGTRALMLSGALGGLLGALEPPEFLPAANAYLMRQEWGEGFATAIHLVLDLQTGVFELRRAGHPPAVQFHAGSGRWQVHGSEGPILGLITQARFDLCSGRLLSGDALLLYTDGLVETPQRDISLGIDKLVGEAERLVPKGFDRGASRLVDRIDSQHDDRALLLLHRR